MLLDPIQDPEEAKYDCEECNQCVLCDSSVVHFNDERMEWICDACEKRLKRHSDELYAEQMAHWVESTREVFEKHPEDQIREYWWRRSEHGR